MYQVSSQEKLRDFGVQMDLMGVSHGKNDGPREARWIAADAWTAPRKM